ncbi:MAG: small multi-drug export protein [Actinobacteria bacterium]|nr:small multi-drug export protein [Actinomycetota bacterium]MBM3712276.1 small multi-drug export protein [Actinomycetota bacterium]
MFFENFTANIGNYFAVFFTAMTPIGELRASIPVGLGVYRLDIFSTLIISIIGNIIPAVVIVYALEPISKFLMKRFRPADRFFTWLFNRTRRKYYKKFEKYSGYALATFVGIPLPVTGAWTGALIAFVFGIPPKKAILDIFLGILMASAIVTVIFKTVGYVKFITVG